MLLKAEKLAHVPQIRCTMEIKRDIYLNQLVNARQNGFIKEVTDLYSKIT